MHNKSSIFFSILIIFLFIVGIYLDAISKSLIASSMITKKKSAKPVMPKYIAITFDDGPDIKTTPILLDGLKKRGIKATFFIIGENAEKYPEIIKRMSDEGHLIGNHTYSHINLQKISKSDAVSEITKTNAIIESNSGQMVKFIRPPYGSIPKDLQEETCLTPVLWTIDSRDWSVLNSASVARHIISRAHNGDIILLHDIFDTSVEAAFIVIDELQKHGFQFVTADKLITPNKCKKSS